jgi:hypothetical protein
MMCKSIAAAKKVAAFFRCLAVFSFSLRFGLVAYEISAHVTLKISSQPFSLTTSIIFLTGATHKERPNQPVWPFFSP